MLPACSAAPPKPTPHPTIELPPADRITAVLPLVQRSAARHHVPPELVLGVIRVESNFRPLARSRVGARGLMQLMPRTAASLARRLEWEDHDIVDPAFNIEAGTSYIAYLLKYFKNDVSLALAAYNSGPGRVRGWQRRGRALPAYSRRYVAAVLAARDKFVERKQQPDAGVARPQPNELDRAGLRDLIRDQRRLYGERPDETL